MTSENIQTFTRTQPFKPFRVTLTTGEEFDIGWPDECMTGSGLVLIPRACCRGTWGGFGSVVRVPLDRVAGLEYPAAPPVDRSTV